MRAGLRAGDPPEAHESRPKSRRSTASLSIDQSGSAGLAGSLSSPTPRTSHSRAPHKRPRARRRARRSAPRCSPTSAMARAAPRPAPPTPARPGGWTGPRPRRTGRRNTSWASGGHARRARTRGRSSSVDRARLGALHPEGGAREALREARRQDLGAGHHGEWHFELMDSQFEINRPAGRSAVRVDRIEFCADERRGRSSLVNLNLLQ